MKGQRSRWLLASLFSAGFAIWMVWAFPRLHPAARLRLEFDRDGYLDLSRRFAEQHGVNLSGWRGSVEAETLVKNQDLRLRMPADEMARTFPDARVRANFRPAGKENGVNMTFRPDGHPLGWKFPVPAQSRENKPGVQNRAMHEVAGDDSANYTMTSSSNSGPDGQEFKWQRSEHGAGSPHIAIAASVKNGFAWKSDTVFSLPESISQRFDAFPAARAVLVVCWMILLLAALTFPVLREGSGRTARALKDSSALRLTVAGSLGVALAMLLEWDDLTITGTNIPAFGIEILGVVLGAMSRGLPLYLMLAGTVLNAGLHPARVRALRLLGTRAILSRTVGVELLGGWITAPIMVGLPLMVSAITRAPAFKGYDDTLLLGHTPIIAAMLRSPDQGVIAVLGLLGVLIPFALRLFALKHFRWPVIVLLSFLTFTMLSSPFRQAETANLICAALQGCLLTWLYSSFGMLGALTSYCSAQFLTAAGVLLVQPAEPLHTSGLSILAAFAGFGAIVLIAVWKGPDAVTELYGESGVRLEARSRREELIAEFNVARTAQQRMLPANPPALEGYSLAAACHPAREVGGDLYDFLRLSDGRWGIGVADVSGKGVPAALYMTLTKGLLTAAAQDSSDPLQILASVNKHLRTVTKKKMFVTMALGVLDPVSRTVEYARAGHNPAVWRRTGARETRLLSGAGIGLGIAGPALFGKTLRRELLTLEPGDALIFYSDGLTEAMNATLEQFGDERLVAAVERTDGMAAGPTRDSILNEVSRFLKGGHSQDDLTIAVLRVNGDYSSNGR